MSHISASRMPHAYAKPASDTDEKAGRIVPSAAARDTIGKISRGTWALGAIGIGAVGAALYATFRPKAPAPKKRRTAARKLTQRRSKAA